MDAATGVDAEVRLYDRLFSVEDPDAAEGGFTSVLNPDSLTTVTAKVEPALADAPSRASPASSNASAISFLIASTTNPA